MHLHADPVVTLEASLSDLNMIQSVVDIEWCSVSNGVACVLSKPFSQCMKGELLTEHYVMVTDNHGC